MNANLSFDPSIPVQEAESETDEIIYRISHDLRASVRALQELPSWITEDLEEAAITLPGATDRHLELIGSHASRLDLMLTGLLEYSRVGRMQAIASLKPANVLEDVIEDLGFGEEVRISREIDHGNVQIGSDDLQRIFSALILNAVRFHPEKSPQITITGGPISEKEWQFVVTDDGPGIPADKAEFVTRPMTKLVSRDVDPGAGMGLAILRKVAFTYGGNVHIGAPKSGTGTQVTVTLRVN
ncbi:MAG: HAMP domain-containing histidine kinase [Silicimonas sp.]|nr:HAMP domain-containing histidine kinase [Silicimonas sp.]